MQGKGCYWGGLNRKGVPMKSRNKGNDKSKVEASAEQSGEKRKRLERDSKVEASARMKADETESEESEVEEVERPTSK
jgi:hypothetical protein